MYLNQDLNQNLLLAYRFGGTGTGVYNYGSGGSNGYVNNGLVGNAHWTPSGRGGTSGFYTSGQATIRPNFNYAPTGDFSMFINAAFLTGVADSVYLISTQTTAGFSTCSFIWNVNNGGFLSIINAQATAVSPVVVPTTPGTSAFLGLTYERDFQRIRWYMSGNYIGTGSVPYPITGKIAQPLVIGGTENGAAFDNSRMAIYDDVFIFNRALSSGEVLSLYNNVIDVSTNNVSCADLSRQVLTSRNSEVLSRISGPDAGLFSINSLGDLTFNTPVNALTPRDANLDGTYSITVEEYSISQWKNIAYNITPYKEAPPLRALVRASALRRSYNPPTVTGVAASSGSWSGYSNRFNDYTYYG